MRTIDDKEDKAVSDLMREFRKMFAENEFGVESYLAALMTEFMSVLVAKGIDRETCIIIVNRSVDLVYDNIKKGMETKL